MKIATTPAPAIVAPADSLIKFSLAQLAKDCIEAGCDFTKSYDEQKRSALTALNQGFKLVEYQGDREQFFAQMKRAASKLKKVVAPVADVIADVIREFTAETLVAFPAPVVAEALVASELIELTSKEIAELKDIFKNQYHDSDSIDSIIGNPVWNLATSKAQGGVIASLLKKGLIGQDGKGNDSTVWIVKTARPLVELLIALGWSPMTYAAYLKQGARVAPVATEKKTKRAKKVADDSAPVAERVENSEPLTNIDHKGPAVTAANKHSQFAVFLKRADGQLAGRATRARMKNKKLQVYLPDVMAWARVFSDDVVYQQRVAQ